MYRILQRCIFLTLVVLPFFCCHSNKKEGKLERYIEKFESKYVNHFLDVSDHVVRHYSFQNAIKGYDDNKGMYLRIWYELNEDDLTTLKSSLNKNVVTIVEPGCDSCLVLSTNSLSKDYPLKYPIPSFGEELIELGLHSNMHLPNDFKLYILEYAKGKYISKDLLYKPNDFPEEWKHGFSKGVAISDERNSAIFWIEIW